MKKFQIIFLSVSTSLLLTGCSGCSNEEQNMTVVTAEELLPPHLDFSSDDSVAVQQLANNYLEAFSAKDYESAADMLFKYENDSVRTLTSKERSSYLKTMRQLPNFGSKFKGMMLRNETNNRIIYTMLVNPNGNLDTDEGVMKFYLNPVMKNGEWFLTLLDMEQEGTEDIYTQK